MTEQIYHSPDIYRIFVPLPQNPLKNLNCYVIASGGEYLIIDTGFNRPECKEAFFAGIEELGIDLSRTRLFLTHLHGDHCGLSEYLTEKGVPAYMNAIDYEYLRGNLECNTWSVMENIFRSEGFPDDEIQRQLSGNQARNFAPHYLFPAIMVKDQDTITVGDVTLLCIHTPGHTPGHTCLYLASEKILFSGDHVLFDITPNISIWNNVPASLADYMESLNNIRSLEVVHTFPGHREFHGDLQIRIDSLIHHHHERLKEILTAVINYPDCTAYETAGRIGWSARGRAWADFSPNQKWFAMGETLAHLRWLQAHGAVEKTEAGRYRALLKPSELTFEI